MGPKIHEIMRGIVFNVLRVADTGLIMLSFGFAAALSIDAGKWITIETFFASRVSVSSCVLLAIAILLCHAMFSLSGLYESKRMSTKTSEAADVLRAMTFSTACLWCEGKAFSILVITLYFLVAFWAIGSASVIVMRLLLRVVLGLIRKRGRNLHHVLVLGTNARAIEFGRMVSGMPDRGYRLVGFVDNDWPRMEEFKATGFRLACDYDGLAEFLRHNVVDDLAMFLPLRSFYERAAEIAKLSKQHGIILRFDKDIFDLKLVRRGHEVMDDGSQITGNSNGTDEWQLLLKRMLDVVGSLVLLILLAPLFLVVAALIKLTSPGPVFFAQSAGWFEQAAFYDVQIPDHGSQSGGRSGKPAALE